MIGQNMENVQRLVEREPKLVHMSVTIPPRNTRVTIVTGAQRNLGLVKLRSVRVSRVINDLLKNIYPRSKK